eukprot:gene27307-22219_t
MPLQEQLLKQVNNGIAENTAAVVLKPTIAGSTTSFYVNIHKTNAPVQVAITSGPLALGNWLESTKDYFK